MREPDWLVVQPPKLLIKESLVTPVQLRGAHTTVHNFTTVQIRIKKTSEVIDFCNTVVVILCAYTRARVCWVKSKPYKKNNLISAADDPKFYQFSESHCFNHSFLSFLEVPAVEFPRRVNLKHT